MAVVFTVEEAVVFVAVVVVFVVVVVVFEVVAFVVVVTVEVTDTAIVTVPRDLELPTVGRAFVSFS